eukprot:TRINITY_DN13648_c0_g1_i2.p1 TRINITY_DN13648_c0_g1~~TRINITY_DN13648_c0_g1_i2.p1  ORF type:complete len:202 (+),score=-7.09 TRINITY_DN13648_c0_g1_i2:166-771(+)
MNTYICLHQYVCIVKQIHVVWMDCTLFHSCFIRNVFMTVYTQYIRMCLRCQQQFIAVMGCLGEQLHTYICIHCTCSRYTNVYVGCGIPSMRVLKASKNEPCDNVASCHILQNYLLFINQKRSIVNLNCQCVHNAYSFEELGNYGQALRRTRVVCNEDFIRGTLLKFYHGLRFVYSWLIIINNVLQLLCVVVTVAEVYDMYF